jgi:Uma2 family endonuclease
VQDVASAGFDIERESRLLEREKPYIELIDGIKVRKVSPRHRHGILQMEMGFILRTWAGRRGRVSSELRVWLVVEGKRTSLLPDVAFIDSDRMAGLSDIERDLPRFAPDIAVEIRSPSDRKSNIARKIALYLAHGSRLVLDVDPATRTIVAHDGVSFRTFGSEETFAHPAAEGLTFDIGAFFEWANLEGF